MLQFRHFTRHPQWSAKGSKPHFWGENLPSSTLPHYIWQKELLGVILPSHVSLSRPGMRLLDTAREPQQQVAGRGQPPGGRALYTLPVCTVLSPLLLYSALQRAVSMGEIPNSIVVWMWDTPYRPKAWSLVPTVTRGVAFRMRLDHEGWSLVPGWMHCHSYNPTALLGGDGNWDVGQSWSKQMRGVPWMGIFCSCPTPAVGSLVLCSEPFHVLLSGHCLTTGLKKWRSPWTGPIEIRIQNESFFLKVDIFRYLSQWWDGE